MGNAILYMVVIYNLLYLIVFVGNTFFTIKNIYLKFMNNKKFEKSKEIKLLEKMKVRRNGVFFKDKLE